MAALDLPDAEIRYDPEFLGRADADRLFAVVRDGAAWEEKTIRIFGRELTSPRLTAWYGDPGAVYRYSGLVLEPLAWLAPLAELRAAVERAVGTRFDSVLANYYRSGLDSMGWHSDDEAELGPEPVIASVSLGAPRRFVLRHRRERGQRHALELAPGSLLVMAGPTQRYWQHAAPKTRRAVGARINLTFRRVLPR